MIRCANCCTVWLGTPDDEAILYDFLAHPCQTIAARVPQHVAAAPLPTTHGSVAVERGPIVHRASVIGNDTHAQLPARMMHPSARWAAIPGGAA